MHLPARRLAPAALALLLLTACGSGDEGVGTNGAATSSPSDTASGEGPDSSDSPDPALSGSPTPTVPPGDPDSTESGDQPPDGDDGHGDKSGEGRDAAVSPTAMLDAATVSSLAGGKWAEAAGALGCGDDPTPGALASRSLGFTASSGALIEVVGTYADKASAVAAVPKSAQELESCGYAESADPRLGDASLQMEAPEVAGAARRALVVAVDGALVVLVGEGSPAAPGTWESLADIAFGTACAASPHGCH